MKTTELREKSKIELSEELSKLRLELGGLTRGHRTGGLKDTSVFKKGKRDIARIMTVVREKEILCYSQNHV